MHRLHTARIVGVPQVSGIMSILGCVTSYYCKYERIHLSMGQLYQILIKYPRSHLFHRIRRSECSDLTLIAIVCLWLCSWSLKVDSQVIFSWCRTGPLFLHRIIRKTLTPFSRRNFKPSTSILSSPEAKAETVGLPSLALASGDESNSRGILLGIRTGPCARGAGTKRNTDPKAVF